MSDLALNFDARAGGADLVLVQLTGLGPAGALSLPSGAGSVSTPENGAIAGLVNNLDLRVKAALTDWTPGTAQALAALADAVGTLSWEFGVETNGQLYFDYSDDGGTPGTVLASGVATGVADGATKWLRVTSNGVTVRFYTSDDGVAWVQLGADQAEGSGFFDNPAQVLSFGAGADHGSPSRGTIYYAEARRLDTGVVAAKMDPTLVAAGAGSFVSGTGETWTVHAPAVVVAAPGLGGTAVTFPPSDLATDDGLEVAVMLSLFTDRRADPSDALPDASGDLRGWWGDALAQVEGDTFGSKLWLLSREKSQAKVVPLAEKYAREALQWLLDDQVAQAVDATVELQAPGLLAIEVDVTRPQAAPANFRYNYAWAAQAAKR